MNPYYDCLVEYLLPKITIVSAMDLFKYLRLAFWIEPGMNDLEPVDAKLFGEINGRRVIIDACVSRVLARNLKKAGLRVRHVADINTALKDHEIAKLMHTDEVLITRDYQFYKMMGKSRAILIVASRSDRMYTEMDLDEKRKHGVRRKNRLPSHIRIALREKLADEAKTGLLFVKILCGIIWLLEIPVP